MFRLTKCWRSDPEHFAWYITVPGVDLETAKYDARVRLPVTAQNADWNLVISHWRRMKLNDELQKKATEAYKREGGTDIIRIEVEEDDETKKAAKTQSKNRGQDYDLWPGTRLIGSDNETKHVVNGAILEVIGVDGDTVQIPDIESKEEF